MAADSYSGRLRLRLQATGGNPNTWGSLLNAAGLQLVEDAICGMANVTVANGAVTLSANNGAQDQARMAIINLTGAPTSGQNVVIPQGITKLYLVVNGTGQTMTVTTLAAGGATVAIGAGLNQFIFTDGTNVAAVQATISGQAPDSAKLGGALAANFPQLGAVNKFTAAQAVAFSNLTDGATIALNAQLSDNFYVLLAGNRALTISNPTDGQEIEVWIQQDATGGRTLTWPANVQFESGGTGTLSASANALDRYVLKYNAGLNKYVARPGLAGAPAGVVGVVFDSNEMGVDLFTRAGSPGSAVTVNVTVNAGVIIRAPDAGTPAFDTSGFPSGTTINMTNLGYILGRGGNGGGGGEAGYDGGTLLTQNQGQNGTPGGTALRAPGTGVTLNVTNGSGFIWGGGGGGGGGGADATSSPGCGNGGGGGGGAGGGLGGLGGSAVATGQHANGSPGVSGASTPRGTAYGTGGTSAASGGDAGNGGAGGDWGSGGTVGANASTGTGRAGVGGAAGAAGKAVDLNGGSINFLSGSGGPNVKGLVA